MHFHVAACLFAHHFTHLQPIPAVSASRKTVILLFSFLSLLTGSSSCLLKSTDTQEKLDFELRMREGAYKLLLACSKREQVLNASKNLLTCNARIEAYLAQLQKGSEEQGGMVAAARR